MTNFEKFATYLENTYGVQYDREERFVCCGECAEPLYEDDWAPEHYMVRDEDGNLIKYVCPICEEEL